MDKTLEDFIGNTPLVRLQRLPGKTTQRAARQAGGQQPGRLGQGPARAVDDQARARARRNQARRYADRADQRQHRHRARDGRCHDGLSHGAGDARAPVDRAAPDDGGVRRRDRADAANRRHGNGARRGRENARRRQGRDPRPVRQSGQSARALREARARKSGAIPKAKSRTSSPAWAPPARSWACRAF